MNRKIVYPDYKNCIANLPNSILKKFGAEPVGEPLAMAEPYLARPYRNVVVFLLDGMGKVILERHLPKDGPFRTNLKGIYTSTFLSTTVAATTSMMSGLQPCEHSWLGWDCYYPQIDKNVTCFYNFVQGTEEKAAEFNVPWTFTPYESVVEKIGKLGKNAVMYAPFWEPKTDSIREMCERVKTTLREPGEHYIYVYWNQPDGLLHRNGCGAEVVHETMLELEEAVSDFAAQTDRDTLVMVTADHGHMDTENVDIRDYPSIVDCLVRMPSLEPRVLNLFVKEEKKDFFVSEWNQAFGDRFLLMPMEEVIERKLMGTGRPHALFRQMLGDYLAIATGNLSIFYTGEHKWTSNHGSLVEDEMLIPFIVFD
ncbi:MAG: alkaline phosphatase family protein [Lachnospiraceae bacterium]|nr:alkaline phosphatase family protein [Lachnospiraceae bacterium]